MAVLPASFATHNQVHVCTLLASASGQVALKPVLGVGEHGVAGNVVG